MQITIVATDSVTKWGQITVQTCMNRTCHVPTNKQLNVFCLRNTSRVALSTLSGTVIQQYFLNPKEALKTPREEKTVTRSMTKHETSNQHLKTRRISSASNFEDLTKKTVLRSIGEARFTEIRVQTGQ